MSKRETKLLASEASNFIQEQYEDFIVKVVAFRDHDSSVNSKSDPTQNVFFEAFKSFRMKICDIIYIPTRDWALAFMQSDLKSTAVKLCRGIYYCHFNNFGNSTGSDITSYEEFILRAALWMQVKDKDPWSYVYDSFEITPTLQQIEIMEIAMQKFMAECRSLDMDTCLNELVDNITTSTSALQYDLDDLNQIMDTLEQATEENVPNFLADVYLTIFQSFMDHLSRRPDSFPGARNPALIATALTRVIIPKNKDIRVDAVPFANNRWTSAAAAANHPTMAETAEKLYSTHFYFDFIVPDRALSYKGFEDVCPFTRLAIYRGSMFLEKMWRGEISAGTWDFNQEIPEHNWYPSSDEKAEIHLGFDKAARKNLEKYNIYPATILEVSGTTDSSSSTSGYAAHLEQPGPSHATTNFTALDQAGLVQHAQIPVSQQNDDNLPLANGVLPAPRINWAELDITEYEVSQDVRTETQTLYNSNRLKAAGSYLFNQIFLRVEKENCNLNGDRGYRKFNQAKVNAFFDTMQQIVGETGENWTRTEKLLRSDVFTVYCTQKYRGPEAKKRNEAKKNATK